MTANLPAKNLPNSSFLAKLLDSVKDQHTDLVLSPGGFGVHKSLLAKLSPLLTSMLTTMDNNEVVTLVLPQVESSIVEKMVELVYTGRCMIAHSKLYKLHHLLNSLDLSLVLDSLNLCEKTLEDTQDVQFECEVCGRLFGGGEAVKYHIHQRECRGKEVKIVPFTFFKQESRPFQQEIYSNPSLVIVREEDCDKLLNDELEVEKELKIRASQNEDQENPQISNQGQSKRKHILYNFTICKLCFCTFKSKIRRSSVQVSRHQAANHLFSQHFKKKIINMLSAGQTLCDVCGKNFSTMKSLARHLGETHEWAIKLYEENLPKDVLDTSKLLSNKKKHIISPTSCPSQVIDNRPASASTKINTAGFKQLRYRIIRPMSTVERKYEDNKIKSRRLDKSSGPFLTASYRTDTAVVKHLRNRILKPMSTVERKDEVKKIKSRRLDLSTGHFLTDIEEKLRTEAVVVKVINEAPFLQDLDESILEDCDIKQFRKVIKAPIRLAESLPHSLCIKYLVHGRNNVAWQVDMEDYSDCVFDWVKTSSFKFVMDFADLTIGEKDFFCLWNQFLLDSGYVGWVGRVHMEMIMDRFVEKLGGQVVEKKLYRQFLLHLSQMKNENLLSQVQMLKMVARLQQVSAECITQSTEGERSGNSSFVSCSSSFSSSVSSRYYSCDGGGQKD